MASDSCGNTFPEANASTKDTTCDLASPDTPVTIVGERNLKLRAMNACSARFCLEVPMCMNRFLVLRMREGYPMQPRSSNATSGNKVFIHEAWSDWSEALPLKAMWVKSVNEMRRDHCRISFTQAVRLAAEKHCLQQDIPRTQYISPFCLHAASWTLMSASWPSPSVVTQIVSKQEPITPMQPLYPLSDDRQEEGMAHVRAATILTLEHEALARLQIRNRHWGLLRNKLGFDVESRSLMPQPNSGIVREL